MLDAKWQFLKTGQGHLRSLSSIKFLALALEQAVCTATCQAPVRPDRGQLVMVI